MSEATTPATPALSTANVTAAPTTTALGIGLASQALATLATNGVPTTTQGWFAFALPVLMGLAGIFGK